MNAQTWINETREFLTKERSAGGLGKLKASDRVVLYNFLSALLRSDRSLQDAAADVAKELSIQASHSHFGNGSLIKMRRIYEHIESNLRNGRPLSSSLRGMIPDSEILMLVAGERGNLVDGLRAASMEAQAKHEMQKVFSQALTYPVILFFVLIGALIFIGNKLLPSLALITPVENWTAGQQNFFWMTTHVHVWLPVVIVALVFVGVGISQVNKRVVGRPREAFQWLVPFNAIRNMTAANYLMTLASLITAGETLKDALAKIKNNTESKYLKFYLSEAQDRQRQGAEGQGGPGAVIGSRLFKPWVMVKLRIYGQGSIEDFSRRMLEIAGDSQEEARKSLVLVSRIIWGTMVIGIAVVIGFTVVTQYGINASMQGSVGGY